VPRVDDYCAVAVKTNTHANRSASCVRLEPACISRLAAGTWVPRSRSTAVRDDSLAPTSHMGARDGEGEDFLHGACPTSASTMFALLCSNIFSLPCFDCRTREQVLMHSLRNDGESWSLRDNSLQLAIDGTLGEARVHACKWSRFHISIKAQTVQSTLARIRASGPPAHHKAAESAFEWST
jgi:hypothetical protein